MSFAPDVSDGDSSLRRIKTSAEDLPNSSLASPMLSRSKSGGGHQSRPISKKISKSGKSSLPSVVAPSHFSEEESDEERPIQMTATM